MTKVVYKVGDTFTNDYLIAQMLASETDEDIETFYNEEYYEPSNPEDVKVKKDGYGFYPTYNEVPITMVVLVK